MQAVTKRQQEVLSFLTAYIADKGVTPTFAAIKAHFGFQSRHSAHKHLLFLEKKGLIKRPMAIHPRAGAPVQILHSVA